MSAASVGYTPSGRQSDLRPFIVYDDAPIGCIPFVVADEETAPLLRPGDVVLIDTRDREPSDRDLFLIQRSSGRRSIVETFLRPVRYWQCRDGEAVESFGWSVGAFNRPRGSAQIMAAARRGLFVSVDGPYATEGAGAAYLQSKLIGRVVGLLQPSLQEMKRIGRGPWQ
jgi:hypothetical protein